MDVNNNKISLDKNNAIEIHNFTKKFKKFKSLDNISFNVRKHTIHGFIGPNGSGKTTTIKTLMSAILPTKGDLFINSISIKEVESRKELGYIPENVRFPNHLTAKSYIATMAYLRGFSKKEAAEKAETILKKIGLWKFKNKKPKSFSSGMQKKVLLAQALINNPNVLILDEPAANLDPTARMELFDELKKLRDEGKTILICSHILSELKEIVDDVTILSEGKILYSGSAIVEQDTVVYKMTFFKKEEANIAKDLILALDEITLVNERNNSLSFELKHKEQIKEIVQILNNNNIIVSSQNIEQKNITNLYAEAIRKDKNNKTK